MSQCVLLETHIIVELRERQQTLSFEFSVATMNGILWFINLVILDMKPLLLSTAMVENNENKIKANIDMKKPVNKWFRWCCTVSCLCHHCSEVHTAYQVFYSTNPSIMRPNLHMFIYSGWGCSLWHCLIHSTNTKCHKLIANPDE